MPRLSEPMRAALRMADQHGCLVHQWGRWTHNNPVWTTRQADFPPRASWTALPSTVAGLTNRGLLRRFGAPGRGEFRVITPEGRAAIGQGEGAPDV